jgi:hypothetical protein
MWLSIWTITIGLAVAFSVTAVGFGLKRRASTCSVVLPGAGASTLRLAVIKIPLGRRSE